jgi:hypothetical protein
MIAILIEEPIRSEAPIGSQSRIAVDVDATGARSAMHGILRGLVVGGM